MPEPEYRMSADEAIHRAEEQLRAAMAEGVATERARGRCSQARALLNYAAVLDTRVANAQAAERAERGLEQQRRMASPLIEAVALVEEIAKADQWVKPTTVDRWIKRARELDA